ncbi:MAG: HAD-IA family hydrolase [Gammaproteobacteria bacterium]
MTIAAVLWDFGGVLTTSPFDAFNRFEDQHDIPRNFIRGINAVNPTTNAWARFESSQINLEEFDRAFARESKAAGHYISGSEIVSLLAGDVRPRMVEVLKRCKATYKVACITNNVKAGGGRSMAACVDRAAAIQEVMALFECVVESSREGIRKPDPAIYRLACDRLGVSPTESVYLDDLGINLKPARALGMRTIKVVTEGQAIADLEKILGFEFAFNEISKAGADG